MSLTSSFQNDPQTKYNYGPLNTDLRHTARGWIYWDLPTDPWTQQVGAIFAYDDGYPDERFYVSETPFPSYSLRVAPRGTYLRFNPVWSLSVQFTQTIDVRKGDLLLLASAQNIFNNRSPEIGNGYLVDLENRHQTIYRQNPLQLQFGAQYRF